MSELVKRIENLSAEKRALLELLRKQEHLKTADLPGLKLKRRSENTSLLVPLQPQGRKRPLFCAHPVGGGVACYSDLAHRHGATRPFYAFQSPGYEGEEEPCADLVMLARRYIKAMKTVQARGPYLLGGWSMGGVIAYEIAQQLKQQGDEIDLLVMIDSVCPASWKPFDPQLPAEKAHAKLIAMFARDLGIPFSLISDWEDRLAEMALPEQLPYALKQMRRVAAGPFTGLVEETQRLFNIFKVNVDALLHYQIRPLEIPFVLIRADESSQRTLHPQGMTTLSREAVTNSRPGSIADDPMLGWEQMARRGVRVRWVLGNHYSILKDPQVKELDSILKSLLEEVEATYHVE